METNRLIGFLGADWWGSDARAMAMSFRRQGHLLIERHYEDYLPTKWQHLALRTLRRLALHAIRRQYNTAVRELLSVQAMDCVVVFKGMLLEPGTLIEFNKKSIPCYLVYPDVSFHDHGHNIWDCLPLYNSVFTTKSYHLADQAIRARCRHIQLINHGYDPEVHRPVGPSKALLASYGCDVSFVGCWSEKKEQLIRAIIEELPDVNLALWGPHWGRARAGVRARWKGRGAYGDELAAIYSCSKVNLGLLSEAGSGVEIGDQTTARSWQIPAVGGLMLHEDNEEIRMYFRSGEEMAVFDGPRDLLHQIQALLGNEERRESIRLAGQRKCLAATCTYDSAVASILDFHHKSAASTTTS